MELWWAGPSPGRWRGGISSLAKSGKGERTGGCSLPPRLQERQGERQRIYSKVEKTDRGTQSPGKQTKRSGELAGGQVQSMGS